MKVIIAGSRNCTSYEDVCMVIDLAGFTTLSEVVSGHAKGVDMLGEKWAKENNIPIKLFPANWEKYGLRAGPIRNRQMAEYAEGLIAVWDGYSYGTRNMISQAKVKSLPMYVYILNQNAKT